MYFFHNRAELHNQYVVGWVSRARKAFTSLVRTTRHATHRLQRLVPLFIACEMLRICGTRCRAHARSNSRGSIAFPLSGSPGTEWTQFHVARNYRGIERVSRERTLIRARRF